MYLFFDTETTGLPRNWKAPVTDLDNWPRMIQIGWIMCDQNGNRLETKGYVIKPEDFLIPKEASDVHGITIEKAMSEGVALTSVLGEFNHLIEQSEFIVAHNINFDRKILGAELIRKQVASEFETKRMLCTMQSSTDKCKITGPYGYKWPTLSELHTKLFGEDFEGAHDASADINATERCFWEMKNLGWI